MLIAGIEAGGTKINCGIGTETGEILERVSIKTTDSKETIDKIIEYFKDKKFDKIGLASFGPLDNDKNSKTYGYITTTPKKGWTNTDFVGKLKEHFDVEIVFDTDVNAAALAESMWGVGKNLNSLLYLTVGTGVGGGFILNHKIFKAKNNPEMGHIFVNNKTGFKGVCPFHENCLEGLVSGPAILKRANKPAENLESSDIIWEEMTDNLAQALVDYTLILSPDVIVLGGGVMKQEFLFCKLREKFLKLINSYVKIDDIDRYIVYPKLGEFCGFYGALALAI